MSSWRWHLKCHKVKLKRLHLGYQKFWRNFDSKSNFKEKLYKLEEKYWKSYSWKCFQRCQKMENSRIIVTYVSVYSWTTTKKSWWTMSNKPSYNKKPKLKPWWLINNDDINQFACRDYRITFFSRWHLILTAILLCNQFWIVDNGYLQWVHTPTLDLLILEIDNFLPVNVWTR